MKIHPSDESRWLTHDLILSAAHEAAPYLGDPLTLTALQNQARRRGCFLPHFRGKKHHAPVYWRLSDFKFWAQQKFAALPPDDLLRFLKKLRETALDAPPLEPVRKSRAGGLRKRGKK